MQWFLKEIDRYQHGTKATDSYKSEWISQSSQHGQYQLRDGVQIHLYVSTVPCTVIQCSPVTWSPYTPISRWRRFHTFAGLYARRKNGITQGFHCSSFFQSK
jgi:tRNA-specific adenosine deaminase 1